MLRLGTTEKMVIYLLFSNDGWLATREIVDLLGKIRKSESAVRATLFRLRRKNVVKSMANGRETLFALGESGKELADDYLNRLARSKQKWNGKWLLFSFNIPESKRRVRNVLRDELIFLGFGRLHVNLWISPYDLRKECNDIVKRLKIKEHTAMFVTDYASDNPKKLAYRVWNLGELTRIHNQLKEKCEREFATFRKVRFKDATHEALEALVKLLRLKEEIVDLAVKDPYLPHELLPPDLDHDKCKQAILDYENFLSEKASSLVKFSRIDLDNKKCLQTECG